MTFSSFLPLLAASLPPGYSAVQDGRNEVLILRGEQRVAVANLLGHTYYLLGPRGESRRWEGPEHEMWGGPYVGSSWQHRFVRNLAEALRENLGEGPTRAKTKGRGFASMARGRLSNVAAMGGYAAHRRGVARCFTPEEAARAGKLGGEAKARNAREGKKK